MPEETEVKLPTTFNGARDECFNTGDHVTLFGRECFVVHPDLFDCLRRQIPERDRFYDGILDDNHYLNLCVQRIMETGVFRVFICRGYQNGSWPRTEGEQNG